MFGFGQKNLSDDGERNVDDGIRCGLDREYPDWKNPTGTCMCPESFPSKPGDDKGQKAEEVVYTLLQQLGTQNQEPMFVVHSYDFSEHIPGNGGERSWVMGESDFVIIHRNHGPIFIQVKATESGDKLKEAEKQIRKDKLALEKHFQRQVKGKISGKKTAELFKNLPAFVAMPNCKQGTDSVCIRDNVLYQEHCSSLEAFTKWWTDKISSAEHPDVPQKTFEYLVMNFVGISHLRPSLGVCIDDTDEKLVFQTKQQMEILSGHYPPKLWIRGPAGSGKTYLLIEKVSALANDILLRKAKEKILVVCFNAVLRKALEKTITILVADKIGKDTDVSSVLHFKTFSKLVTDVANWRHELKTKSDKESAVRQALEECVQKNGSRFRGFYDHIFVDEGQDFYGSNWPELLEKMHKSSVQSQEDDLYQMCGFFWVMYDLNQHLYFSKELHKSHFSHVKGSAVLNKVFRNTEHVFKQSKKYFKPMMPRDPPITLAHKESGLEIIWDDSLMSRTGEEMKGAESVAGWLKKLVQKGKVQAKDICILVETKAKQKLLRDALFTQEVDSQTGDGLVEGLNNCVVVDSIRRFKGMESKVVILYNPPFQDDPLSNTKELLYTAFSRCSCLLIVMSTKDGCRALKSAVGINEERRDKRKHHATYQHQFGNGVPCSQGECELEEVEPFGAKLSLQEAMLYEQQQEQRIKRAKSREPRPMEVDGSNLIEPGDPNISDTVRGNVFSLLANVVAQNKENIPCSQTMDVHVPVIVARIEYEIYCKRRGDCHSRNYTRDLRELKKEINDSNEQGNPNESVVRAVRSASQPKRCGL